MAGLIQGRIVYPHVPVPDPQGRNAKPGRPFVVISPNQVLRPPGENLIKLVGITSKEWDESADHYVELTTGPNARTKLDSQWSAALCTWVIHLTADEFDVKNGFVDGKQLRDILAKVQTLGL